MEATYVLYTPRAKRAGMRAALAGCSGAPVTWRERKLLFGSEFYLTGPAAAARSAHAVAASWLHEG